MANQGERVLPAYGPASLDFINLPNPVEPHAAPHQHPLNNNTSKPERTSKQDFLQIVQNPEIDLSGPQAKRRKSGADNGLNLPRPPLRDEERRPQLPPTLSGLHHPPPDAGILPSISIDKPAATLQLPVRHDITKEPTIGTTAPESGAQLTDVVASVESAADRRKPRKWTEHETSCLLKGVARFGIGKWTQILNCPDYQFDGRTALDLKDRFRVCCPEEYNVSKPKIYRSADGNDIQLTTPSHKRDRMSASDLRSIGIEQPFVRSARRKRRDYSAAEDDAIQRGVVKHHTAWSAILQDEEFKVLRSRQARDLRDRFRTRFPEQYRRLGLIGKSGDAPNRSRAVDKGDSTSNLVDPIRTNDANVATNKKNESTITTLLTDGHDTAPQTTRKAQVFPPLISAADVFWGAPLEQEGADGEPGTLDREIMDWAFDGTGRSQDQSSAAPMSALNTTLSRHQHTPGSSQSVLPPISALTAGGGDEDHEDLQPELPSLMNGLGQLEVDGRASGQLLGLFDLLS